jgi:hypothetical protein
MTCIEVGVINKLLNKGGFMSVIEALGSSIRTQGLKVGVGLVNVWCSNKVCTELESFRRVN